MDSRQQIPGLAIDLTHSDSDNATAKKRKRGDADEQATSSSSGTSLRSSKRAKKAPHANHSQNVQASEEGEIDEDQGGAGGGSDGGDSQSDSRRDAKSSGGKPQSALPGKLSALEQSSLSVLMPAEPLMYNKGAFSLQLPVLAERKGGSWQERFQDWVRVFCAHNPQTRSRDITAGMVLGAFNSYIDQSHGLKSSKKKSARQAASKLLSSGALAGLLESVRPESSQVAIGGSGSGSGGGGGSGGGDKDRLAAVTNSDSNMPSVGEWASLLDDASQKPQMNGTSNEMSQTSSGGPSKGQGGTGARVARKSTLPTGSDALEQQRRYFPSASDPANMCLLCGREGHAADNCPNSVCRFCGDCQHWDFCCPTIEPRCKKCRQLGHDASTCVEELILTQEEGRACSLCKAPEHLEDECTEIWRTFHPDADTTKRVIFLPASCSRCGSGKHYSSDCDYWNAEAGNPTWSLSNRDRYIDSTCSAVSIDEAAQMSGNTKGSRVPEVKIRGHAARTGNVHYSESEDSDVEFLSRQPVKQRTGVGQIRMSTNIQMPSNPGANGPSSYGRSGEQPPLPPGPPPPGPPGLPARRQTQGHPPPPGVSNPGSQPPRPPPSLPAKPPASTRDFRNVPPPASVQGSRGQSWQDGNGGGNGNGNASQRGRRPGKPKAAQQQAQAQAQAQGQRGGHGGGRGGGRGRGRGRGRGGRGKW